jgi:hypothetical protein
MMTVGIIVAEGITLAGATGPPCGNGTPGTDVCTYTYSGTGPHADNFTVPAGVTSISINAYGGAGGHAVSPAASGGVRRRRR